jgi:hypothetical protein
VDEVRRRVERHTPALAQEDDPPPFSRSTDSGSASGVVARAIDGPFDAGLARQLAYLGHIVGASGEHFVADPEIGGQFQALRHYVDADDKARAQLAAEGAGCQADRAQAGD